MLSRGSVEQGDGKWELFRWWEFHNLRGASARPDTQASRGHPRGHWWPSPFSRGKLTLRTSVLVHLTRLPCHLILCFHPVLWVGPSNGRGLVSFIFVYLCPEWCLAVGWTQLFVGNVCRKKLRSIPARNARISQRRMWARVLSSATRGFVYFQWLKSVELNSTEPSTKGKVTPGGITIWIKCH